MAYVPTDLLQRMQGGSTTPSYDPITGQPTYAQPQAPGLPFIYGQAQMPGPPNTGNQYANLALGVLAPIAAQMMGMQNPQFQPQAGPGVTPSMAYYMRDVQAPIFQAAQQQYLWQWGGMMGGAVGAMTGNAQIQQNMINAGQSDIGRMITQMVMSTPIAQNIMGGDPMRMQESIFAARGSFAGNQLVDPRNLSAQVGMARQTNDFIMNLTGAMYGRPDGGMGITPNFSFTRGFGAQDIGTLAQQMAIRGTPGFVGLTETAGMDPGQARAVEGVRSTGRVQQLGQMLGTVSALSELMGGGTMNELITTLDRLTNMRWPTLNAARLEQTFRQMSATAQVIGVSGPTMMATAENFQQGMNMAAGIGPAQAALGVTAGGYADLPVAGYLTNLTLGGAKARGVQGDPVAVARMAAQQTALMNIGFNAPFGRDARLMGWLAETGQIDVGTFNNFVQSTNPEQAQAFANQAFTSAFGTNGPARARRMMLDPAMASVVTQGTQYFAGPVTEGIVNFQNVEFAERAHRGLMQTEAGFARRLATEAGRLPGLPVPLAAHARMQGTLDYLTAVAREPGLAADVRQIFDQATGEGLQPQQAMARVQQFMTANPAFEPHRMAIRQAQQESLMGEETNRIAFLSPELQEDAITRAQRRVWRTDPSLRPLIGEIDGMFARANQMERTGDQTGASKLREDARQKQIHELEGHIPPHLKDAGEHVRAFKSKQLMDIRARSGAARLAGEAIDAGRKVGADIGTVVDEQAAIMRMFEAVRGGQDYTPILMQLHATTDPAEWRAGGRMGNIALALREGTTSTKFLEQEAGQRAVLGALRLQYGSTEAAQGGFAGTGQAVSDRILGAIVTRSVAGTAQELAQSKKLSDLRQSGAYRTFQQRVTEGLTGEISPADVFGLEGLNEQRKLSARDERLQQALEDVGVGSTGAAFLLDAKLSSKQKESLGIKSKEDLMMAAGSNAEAIKKWDVKARRALGEAALQVSEKESKERGEGDGKDLGRVRLTGELVLKQNGVTIGTVQRMHSKS